VASLAFILFAVWRCVILVGDVIADPALIVPALSSVALATLAAYLSVRIMDSSEKIRVLDRRVVSLERSFELAVRAGAAQEAKLNRLHGLVDAELIPALSRGGTNEQSR
jgi:hypothetical protein